MAAKWLILVFFSEQYQLFAFCKTMRMVGRATAFYADGVYLLDVFRDGHKCRHRTERLAEEVCIETCNDDSDAPVCQCLYYFNDGVIEELCFIDAYNFHII